MIHSGTFFTARQPDEVFDLLADPYRFAPLMPNHESLSVDDATRFNLRIVIAVGQINGHANLAMKLGESVRPNRIEYRGEGLVAGSLLELKLVFEMARTQNATEVKWRGELALGGTLALMAGHLIEPMGRENFERMAERLQNGLQEDTAGAVSGQTADADPAASDSASHE
jgi:carbon monoxide dehydrogenase subunit G